MSKRRDWFKWKLRAGTRGTIRRTSRRTGNGFEVMGACVAMLDHARSASHWTENPEGVFTTTIEDLATDYNTPETRVREVLGALKATGWINTSTDLAMADAEEDIHFRIVRYLAFNDPQGSSTDRKAAERDSELITQKALAFRFLISSDVEPEIMAEALDLRGSVTTRHDVGGKCTEEKREEEKREETSVSSTKIRKPRKSKKLVRVSDPELDARVTACFDWYCDLFGKTGVSSLALTQKRYDAIAWALTEYTADQIAQCLRGYHTSTWRRQQLNRHDIRKLFESPEQVEAGIDLAVSASNTAAAGGDERTTALLEFYAQQKAGAA